MKDFIKKEIVLIIALSLAIFSAFFVTPSKKYFGYIDFETLCLLFSLMAIMAGYKKIGLFSKIANFLLKKTNSILGILCVLIFLPFFLSMLITNDVALITFVPFALIVLTMPQKQNLKSLIVPCVVLQTIAANLGSMLLPMGNPQNLYLYSKSGISLARFILIMLPYTIFSFLLIFVFILLVEKWHKKSGCDAGDCGTNENETSQNFQIEKSGTNAGVFEKIENVKTAENHPKLSKCEKNKKLSLILFSFLFLLAFFAIGKVLNQYILALIVLIFFIFYDFSILKNVDYSLLLTFVGFFIFIGNMGNIDFFNNFLQKIILNHETLVSVFLSQIISNVPAALLLSGFTNNFESLIIGTNLGGLGSLIASMASLISFKQIASTVPLQKTKYFLLFTILNIVFLIFLLIEWLIIRAV